MAATGSEIASAYISLQVRAPGIAKDINKALGGVDVSSGSKTVGSRMGAAISGAVGGAVAVAASKAVGLVMGAIDGAVKRVDTMNAFPKIMKNLGYSAEDANKSIKKISDGLAGLPTTLDGMAGTVQQLAPLTGGLDEATTLSLALNNAMLAGGKSTDIQANAMEQYTQMLAIGKVDMSAWRSMVTAMPGQMDQLSVSILGTGNKSMDLYEALKTGKVGFDDFNAAVVKLNDDGVGEFASFQKQALDATDGIGTGWANLQTSITRNLANIIQKLKPVIDAFLVGAVQIANAVGPVLIGLIDVAIAVGGWAAANKDWLAPMAVMVGTIFAVYKGVKLVQAVTLGYQAAMKGAQIATFLTGGALKTYNILTAAMAVKTKIATVAQRAFNFAFVANPIGVVVTALVALVAGLVYFFSSTKTGQAVWAEFTRFLGEAWANISAFFQTVWETVLKPVFDGIATVATWLFENILLPQFKIVQGAFAILGGIFQGIWDFILKPVFEAIGAQFNWLWVNVISPVVTWIQQQWAILGLATRLMWEIYIQPAFKAIGDALNWIWLNIISPVVGWIQEKWAILGLATQTMYERFIKPAWDAVAGVISSGWNTIKGVIDTMVRVIKTDPKLAFEAARDAIGTAWAGIQELAAKPVRFVVDTVINGLINTVNGILPEGMKIPAVKLPKGFASGGILPGMSRMGDGDDQLIAARRGEGVMVSEALRTSADRSAFLAANAAGRGGVGFASMLQGLARGGLVNPLPQGSYSVSQAWGNAGHNGIDLAAPSGTKVFAAADGTVGLAGSVNMGGNEVYIQHANGLGTRYSHLSRFGTQAGAQVKAGNVIGYVGSTGMSTGPHLHYMVHNPGLGAGSYSPNVNPAPYMGIAGSDLGEAGGSAGILGGLVDWAVGQMKGAFPDGGMFIDVASALATSAAQKMAEAFNPFGANDVGTTLYDNGGWLQPGVSLVENKTGRPEPILTGSQWDDLKSGGGGLQPGDELTLVVGGERFPAYIDARADAAVDRGNDDMAAIGRRTY